MKNNHTRTRLNHSVVAIDPGREKFGYAVLFQDGTVLRKGIGKTERMVEIIVGILTEFGIEVVVLGDRTGSRECAKKLIKELKEKPICLLRIDEDNSSHEGRIRYLRDHRYGWRRFVPLGLQTPPEPYDDYVAVILGERYLQKSVLCYTEGSYA